MSKQMQGKLVQGIPRRLFRSCLCCSLGQCLGVGFILKQAVLKWWLKFNQFSNPDTAGQKNVSLPIAPTKCQGVSVPEPVIVARGL